jgi:(1->4)-alpha-D-glucan 1-alpha-D-glucosylmutase
MRIPDATYRLQFNADFGFTAAREIIPYLSELGITDVYASPIFFAEEGSTHGYDVCDPDRLNPELGSESDFDDLMQEVKSRSLGWVQDIVPNHMAFSSRNRRLMDVLKFGPQSAYGNFFDIDWRHPALEGKLLAPFLGKHYAECLESGEIELRAGGGWVAMGYYGLELPLSFDTSFCIDKKGSAETYTIKDVPGGASGLDEIISSQFFAPSFWKRAGEEINYRRFFTINGLISVRVEDEKVFEESHRFLFDLVESGKVTGLRVDHIDGLYDPAEYLSRLKKRSGGMFTVVEKILDLSEDVPQDWPVEGTTGYKFLNYVNGLFCKNDNVKLFSRIYRDFSGLRVSVPEMRRDKKRLILLNQMAGDLDNLTRLLDEIAADSLCGRDYSFAGLREAIAEILCLFPVYRAYADNRGISPADRAFIAETVGKAKSAAPQRAAEIEFTGMVLLGEGYTGAGDRRLNFVRRFQQLTGPLMAKGFEDTLLYNYNRLISLNDVGGDPERFGICPSVFHGYAENEAARHPHALNATATHDTKRGEDARARINVLSEVPVEWDKCLNLWSVLNESKKKRMGEITVPDPNTEYFLYQSLVGSYPFEGHEVAQFPVRLKDYMVKAAREAKVSTDWAQPDGAYEDALAAFIVDILDPELSGEFLASFIPFQEMIARYGIYNSLSQVLIKITVPGIPDFYRGTEIWNFDFVDPDNRRPVDFQMRQAYLKEMKIRSEGDLKGLISDLMDNRRDGRVKLYVIWRALQARREFRPAFHGGYKPIKCSGMRRDCLLSFMREGEGRRVIVIAPRFFTVLAPAGREPLGREAWYDTSISCPEPGLWDEVFTGRQVTICENALVGDILTNFPIALLTSKQG